VTSHSLTRVFLIAVVCVENVTHSPPDGVQMNCQQDGTFDYQCTINDPSDLSRIPNNVQSLEILMTHRRLPTPLAISSGVSGEIMDSSEITASDVERRVFPVMSQNLTKLRVPKSVFPTIRVIDETYRQRAVIPRGAFANLPQLNTLLIYGEASDADGLVLVNGSFDGLSNLADLEMYHLKLDKLAPGSLHGLGRLKSLHLHNNRLTEFPASASASLHRLRYLGLANNRIVDVRKIQLPVVGGACDDTSSECNWDIKVSLHHNLIHHISQSSFIDLNDVTVESSSGSRLVNDVTHDRRRNQTSHVTKSSMAGRWRHVIELNLANNQIIHVGKGSFDGLVSLQHLHLHSNEITAIESGVFSALPQLLTVDISNNSLTSIGALLSGTFDRRNHPLVELYLADNPWNCDCPLRCRLGQLTSNGFIVADSTSTLCRSPAELIDRRVTSLIELDGIVNIERIMNTSFMPCRQADCDGVDDRTSSNSDNTLQYILIGLVSAIALFCCLIYVTLFHIRVHRTGKYLISKTAHNSPTGGDLDQFDGKAEELIAAKNGEQCVLCVIVCCCLSVECFVINRGKQIK